MVKSQVKTFKSEKSPINYTSHTLIEYAIPKKSRQEINRENYQKNKEKLKIKQQKRYQQQKKEVEQQEREQLSKYSQASDYKVLISLKEWTQLNKEKQKIWLDFIWTLKNLTSDGGKWINNISDIVSVMRLQELSDKLISDYWFTAKSEVRKGKSWNILSEEEQERLIKYWGYEKTRKENDYLTEEEKLEKQSKEYLKEIELSKFHEERGKIKCPCYQCGEQKKIRKEIQGKINKELKELEGKETEKDKCNECGKIRILDEENGLCKKCSRNYDN